MGIADIISIDFISKISHSILNPILYEKMNVGNKYHHRNMKKSNIANVWTCRIAGQNNKIFV